MSSLFHPEASAASEPEAYRSQLVPEDLPYDFQQVTETQAAASPTIVSEETKLGLQLLGTSLLVGVVGNLLFRELVVGLNVVLWVGMILSALLFLQRKRVEPILGEAKWLLPPMFFFAATFAWRDSITLNVLSLFAMLLLAALIALRVRLGELVRSGVWDHIQSLLFGSLFVCLGPCFLLLSDTKWNELPREGWSKKTLAIGRGLAIAAPLLLLFGGLFAAADEAFQNLLARTLKVDAGAVVSHLILTGLFAWLTAGFLRLLFIRTGLVEPNASAVLPFSLGIIEIGTVLGLLNGLFLAFVLVQFRYFFGGRANIPSGRGVEFAEYARQGFFELVWVSLLVLPLLLGAHWLLGKDNPAHERIFRALAGVKLMMLFVIMFSAMQRMRLYQSECGLTELRVYTMAFMGWLALVFVWFAATVLRGQRERFAFGASVLGLTMIAALHFVNPDKLIARVNFQRAREGKSFDANYVTLLSADAVPTVLANLAILPEQDRLRLQSHLFEHWEHYEYGDWRGWNWARARARQQLRRK